MAERAPGKPIAVLPPRGDDVMHRIERELDLQEAMLGEPLSAQA